MISIVIPLFNEEESLQTFYKEITKELEKIKEAYEIIFIDDGSNDNSLPIVKDLAKKDKTLHIYSFRKNQGKAEALTLGFQHAQGEYVITLDADLQDKPSEIEHLLKKIDGDWDVVSGWRKNRKDTSKMVVISKIFNGVMNKLYNLNLHDYNCGLKIYTREAAKSLRLYGGLHRFIPLLAYEQGFRVTEIAVEHQKRQFGKSKYGFSKLWRDLPDLFTTLFLVKYGKRPLHFFGTVGGTLFFIGVAIALYLAFIHFSYGAVIGRRPLLLFSMGIMISGLQIFFTGFIAELIINSNNRNYQHPPLKYTSDEI